MKTLILALSLVLPSLASSVAQAQAPMQHLTFLKGELHAHVTWEKGPTAGSESVMHVAFVDKTHHAVELPAKLKVELWMPAMGHGSSPVTVEKALDEQGAPKLGEYRVSQVYFIMSGEWEAKVTLVLADSSQETQTIKVKL